MSYLSENSLYESIRNTVAEAQQKVYVTVNFWVIEAQEKRQEKITEVL